MDVNCKFILGMLCGYSPDHKMVWFDQIENAINMAWEGRQRRHCQAFRENHLNYSGVRCYGQWTFGIMHACCYLEYPDGKMYYGDTKLGDMTGHGRMILPSLGLYEGYSPNGKFRSYGFYE